jgi:hypothetical protein
MIDERFAYIKHGAQRFQVLKYDENGEPYDWDEAATAALYQAYLATL